jgi:Holliday junction DNA helicase RuvB
MGREALAARLGVDIETYSRVHEPWLERSGLVERTERGRVATRKARDLYGAERPGRPRGRLAKCEPIRNLTRCTSGMSGPVT